MVPAFTFNIWVTPQPWVTVTEKITIRNSSAPISTVKRGSTVINNFEICKSKNHHMESITKIEAPL